MKKLLLNTFKFTSLALIAGIISTSCASSSEKKASSSVLTYGPKSGKALVYVIRDSPFGGLVKFNVYVDKLEDEQWAGGCRGVQFIHFYVSPGKHTLYSKTEGPVASVELNCEAGKVYFVRLNAVPGAFVANPILSTIDEATGKSYLNHTREGDQGKTDF